MSVVTLIIFCAAGFFSLPVATAQQQGLYGLPFGFSPFGPWGNIQTVPTPSYLYNFRSSPINQLGAGNYWGANSGLLSSPLLAGSRFSNSPLRSANAYINGATTVFVPPTATSIKVSIKQPGSGIPGIKLSALTPPVTVYIYPSGYVPPAPTTIAPVTTTAPAVISGLGLQRVNFSPYRPAFSYGQTFSFPRTVPSFPGLY